MSQSGLMNAGEERGAAVTPPRSPSAAATPAECHLGLLGTLGQHGRGGQSQEDQHQLDMYMYTHTRARTHVRFLTELVLLRFQQSGLSRFCSSARALASMVYILLSSLFIFFHLSPRMTLMALEQVNNAETKIGKVHIWGNQVIFFTGSFQHTL